MAACQTIAINKLADAWLSLSSLVCGKKQDDEMRRATMLLSRSIAATCHTEDDIQLELRALASRVKSMKSAFMKPELNALLRQSRSKRLRLSQTTKKREALEQHMETLHSSQLNQQVMSSVRQTTDALKAMGLEKELESIDEVMMDLTECHGDVNAIQNGLSSSMGSDAVDDDDLEAEMQLLLGGDGYSPPLAVPPAKNSMHDAPAEALPAPTPPAAATSITTVALRVQPAPASYLEAATLVET